MKSLQKDKSIAILPDDKGNATVILDRSDYDAKEVKRNPTSRVEAQVPTALKECECKGYINSKKRLSLAHQFSSPPQTYGLPMINKEGFSLRPIVAAIGSPTHQLARELARILPPLAGRSPSHVKNLADFVDQICQASLEETDVMASFDVASLVTRVPVNEALVVISQCLQNDTSLKD